MIKYAVIHVHIWELEPQITVLWENFKDIKQAEKFRSDYLKNFPKVKVQNLQVLQYEV